MRLNQEAGNAAGNDQQVGDHKGLGHTPDVGREVINICGGGRAGGLGSRDNDGVIGQGPEQGAGRASHPHTAVKCPPRSKGVPACGLDFPVIHQCPRAVGHPIRQ
eukprot:12172193-Alexandrium_andersonii.AAC.1